MKLSALLLLVAAPAGCANLTGLTGAAPEAGSEAHPDAAHDASGDTGASTSLDSAIADGNLLQNPGFEQGTVGCGPGWGIGNDITATFSPVSHGGSHSCLVCAQTSTGALGESISGPFPAGTSIGFQAYVYVPAADATGPAAIQLDIYGGFPDGGSGDYSSVSGMPVANQWTPITQTTTLAAELSWISFGVTPSSGPSCFLIDDVVLAVQ